MPLIICEMNIILTWSESCILIDMITQAAAPQQEDIPETPKKNAPTNPTFKITDTKL